MSKRISLWKLIILIFLVLLLFNRCTKKPYEIPIDEVGKQVSNEIVEPSYQEITIVEDEDIVSFLLENALELIERSTDEWDKPKELSKIASSYAEVGQYEKAFEIVRKIVNNNYLFLRSHNKFKEAEQIKTWLKNFLY